MLHDLVETLSWKNRQKKLKQWDKTQWDKPVGRVVSDLERDSSHRADKSTYKLHRLAQYGIPAGLAKPLISSFKAIAKYDLPMAVKTGRLHDLPKMLASLESDKNGVCVYLSADSKPVYIFVPGGGSYANHVTGHAGGRSVETISRGGWNVGYKEVPDTEHISIKDPLGLLASAEDEQPKRHQSRKILMNVLSDAQEEGHNVRVTLVSYDQRAAEAKMQGKLVAKNRQVHYTRKELDDMARERNSKSQIDAWRKQGFVLDRKEAVKLCPQECSSFVRSLAGIQRQNGGPRPQRFMSDIYRNNGHYGDAFYRLMGASMEDIRAAFKSIGLPAAKKMKEVAEKLMTFQNRHQPGATEGSVTDAQKAMIVKRLASVIKYPDGVNPASGLRRRGR